MDRRHRRKLIAAKRDRIMEWVSRQRHINELARFMPCEGIFVSFASVPMFPMLTLVLRDLGSFSRGLELWKPHWSLGVEAVGHACHILGLRVHLAGKPLLSLRLLALLKLSLPAQVGWNAGVDLVLNRNFILDEPRGAGPCLSSNCLLDERPKDRLGEDLAVAPDVVIVDDGLVIFAVVQADEVSRKRHAEGAVRQHLTTEPRLVANAARESLTGVDGNGNMLARVEVGFEFFVKSVDQVVDPGYCLELDASKDGSLEGFGEGLFDFLGTSKLDRRSAESREGPKV